jgi:hypothetical protein
MSWQTRHFYFARNFAFSRRVHQTTRTMPRQGGYYLLQAKFAGLACWNSCLCPAEI